MARTGDLLFSFPIVDRFAVLRIQFCRHGTKEQLPVDRAGDDFSVETSAPVDIHLRPELVDKDRSIRWDRKADLYYPFAVMLMVRGINALTGTRISELRSQPQNYFVTPPQGAIDGYFVNGEVQPFRSSAQPEGIRLDFSVYPMRSREFGELMQRPMLIGGSGHVTPSGITLMHGGERQIEPVYEDWRSIGDWDQDHRQIVVVRLLAAS
jgi:hypothetical protein